MKALLLSLLLVVTAVALAKKDSPESIHCISARYYPSAFDMTHLDTLVETEILLGADTIEVSASGKSWKYLVLGRLAVTEDRGILAVPFLVDREDTQVIITFLYRNAQVVEVRITDGQRAAAFYTSKYFESYL
jgi:hypothetical protein